jgi:hypothetical protein
MLRLQTRGAIAVAVSVVLAVVTAGSAMADIDISRFRSSDGPYCASYFKRMTPGKPEATLVYDACSHSPDDPSLRPSISTTYYIAVKLWQHAIGEGKNRELWIEAKCDSAGWGFSDLTRFNDDPNYVDGISAYEVYSSSNCNKSLIYTQTQFRSLCNGFDGNVPFVGQNCNDKVYSMRIWHQ